MKWTCSEPGTQVGQNNQRETETVESLVEEHETSQTVNKHVDCGTKVGATQYINCFHDTTTPKTTPQNWRVNCARHHTPSVFVAPLQCRGRRVRPSPPPEYIFPVLPSQEFQNGSDECRICRVRLLPHRATEAEQGSSSRAEESAVCQSTVLSTEKRHELTGWGFELNRAPKTTLMCPGSLPSTLRTQTALRHPLVPRPETIHG